ncbi:retinoic acid receptor responder protein 2 isoform X2 [Podarcis raffonei]|uniref:retinoic acid receptor responder protein 2 isoform X2 n=1 Tax=Podarcis raffonei TaxID=65483 RepID=UPI00232972F5|nr:retinoic acid receptor responder protein 2 isoform X2 [Podarcis raffonei]
MGALCPSLPFISWASTNKQPPERAEGRRGGLRLGQLSWEQVNDRPRSTDRQGSSQGQGVGSRSTGDAGKGMKGLLVLCLGLLALADANQSPLQQRALELVLDFFHSRDLVQATFKEQAVTHVTETRKQKCLACFKFNSSDPQNILDESKRCLSEQNPIFQEVRRKQNQECEAVKEAYEEQRYHIGQFAFLKGRPEE